MEKYKETNVADDDADISNDKHTTKHRTQTSAQLFNQKKIESISRPLSMPSGYLAMPPFSLSVCLH